MPHIRNNIRDAIATLLTSTTDVGVNVFVNRETSVWRSELPTIIVYSRGESATPRALSGSTYIRQLQLVIEIKVEANNTLDDTLDTIAQQVEAIVSVADIEGTMGRPIYLSTEINLDSGSEIEKGVATLNYQVQYIQ